MRIKTRRILATLLSAVLLLCIAPAAFAVDLSAVNAVTIDLSGTDYGGDIYNADVKVDAYLLAAATEDATSDTYGYEPFTGNLAELQDDFDALLVSKDMASTTFADVDAKFKEIAGMISEIVLGDILNGESSWSPAASGTYASGKSFSLSPADSSADGLAAGLYLLVPHGAEMTAYIETDDEGNMISRAESKMYEYLFTPQLLTLPGKKLTAEDGTSAMEYNTAYGKWIYDVMVTLKPDQQPLFADLEINKTMTTYVSGDEPEFVYHVVAVLDKKTVYDDYTAITITADSLTNSTVVEKIPIGSTITVVEVYTGSRYVIDGEASKEAALVNPDDPKEGWTVSVANKHDDTPPGGYGVLNTFKLEGEDSSLDWNWYKDGELQTQASASD